MEAVDLTGVPVVDNHCHGVATDQAFADGVAWRRAFTESTDPGMPREHVATTALYRRLIRTLIPFLDCDPTEEAVFAARTAREGRDLTAKLLRAANIETPPLDTGFPPPAPPGTAEPSPPNSCAPPTSKPSSSTRASRRPKRCSRYPN